MSLVVYLDRVLNLPGRGDRTGKITFRGLSQFTKVIDQYDPNSVQINFNERLEWPVASNIDNSEVLDIQLFNVSKLFSNKLIGSFRMVLQQVVQDGQVNVCEMLLDQNNTALNAKIFLRLDYQAPDGTVGNWQMEQFGGAGKHDQQQMQQQAMAHAQQRSYNEMGGRPNEAYAGSNIGSMRNLNTLGPGPSGSGGHNNYAMSSSRNNMNNLGGSQMSLNNTSNTQHASSKPKKKHKKDKRHKDSNTAYGQSTNNNSLNPNSHDMDNYDAMSISTVTSYRTNTTKQQGQMPQGYGQQQGLSTEDQKNILRKELIDLMRDPKLNEEEPTIKIEPKKEQPDDGRQPYDLDPLDPNLDALSLTNSDVAVNTNVTNKRSKPEISIEPMMQKPVHFQIQVSVVEAKQLSGTNMDPVCLVQIGDDKKYTSQKTQTNSPYWNEVFVFDYNLSRDEIFDKMMHFMVFTSKNLLRTGNLVGQFKMDIGTIYEQPDHQFTKKWAVLTDPNDLNTGPKGYLKVDISVAGKGDVVRSISTKNDDDEDDIESNMLVPAGLNGERQRARFMFKIYHATGLPKMTTDITGKIKATLLGDTKDCCDSFVEVTFCGQKGKTSIKKASYSPNWSECIIFTELFPPMCTRAKIQLKDNAYLKDYRSAAIGTHYIDLRQVCNPGDKGFLPTFGPTYINLYGAPRTYSMLNEFGDLNEGLGEGVAFRGQLMMAIDVQLVDHNSDMCGSVEPEVEVISQLSEHGAGVVEEFFLFSSILESSMLDKRVADKNIQFELSMGNYGNFMDGENVSKEDEDEDDDTISLASTRRFNASDKQALIGKRAGSQMSLRNGVIHRQNKFVHVEPFCLKCSFTIMYIKTVSHLSYPMLQADTKSTQPPPSPEPVPRTSNTTTCPS